MPSGLSIPYIEISAQNRNRAGKITTTGNARAPSSDGPGVNLYLSTAGCAARRDLRVPDLSPGFAVITGPPC